MIGQKINELDKFVDADVLQHNPGIGDGITALKEALEVDEKEYKRVHRVVAEGEFVALQSEGEIRGQIHTFWDILRIDTNDKIVEQWQVVAVFPDVVAHSNGPFLEVGYPLLGKIERIMNKLTDKVALVTGQVEEIGATIAKRLCS